MTTPNAPHTVSGNWLDVFREGQEQTMHAHLAFQKALTDAHGAYLAAVESTQTALVAALTGQAPVIAAPRALAAPTQASTPAPTYTRPAPLASKPAPIAQPTASNGHHNGHANGATNGYASAAPSLPPTKASAKPAPSVQTSTVTMSTLPTPVAKNNGATVDARATLLAVLADKTGYPADSLDDGMNLEADLGIDSIKRVEILSALKDKLPLAASLDAMHLAQLKTIGDITGALGGATTTTTSPASSTTPTKSATPATTTSPTAKATGNSTVLPTLLDVVSEKTGYPKEALEPSMALETDLGVDSIKRVEILSALKERMPSMPAVDAMQMAQLKTLGEIATALGHTGGAAGPFA